MKNKNLIFVCTGNTCRSPMAEGLLRERLGPTSNWDISSAGVYADDGWPVSENSVQALQEKGIDISPFTSRALTSDLLEHADLLITMTQGHREAILQFSPESERKVFLLKSFGVAQCAADISDPVGQPLERYRQVRDEIDAALPDLILMMMERGQTPK